MNTPGTPFIHNFNRSRCKHRCKRIRITNHPHPQPYQGEWWSQTESNRRHPACKAGALPTELWPHLDGPGSGSPHPHRVMVGPNRFELLTPRLSSVCSNQLSYGPALNTTRTRPTRSWACNAQPPCPDQTSFGMIVIAGKRNEDGGNPHICAHC